MPEETHNSYGRRMQDKYLDAKFANIDDKFRNVEEDCNEVKSDVKTLLKEVSALKVKSGIWGGMSGVVATATVLLAAWGKSLLGK